MLWHKGKQQLSPVSIKESCDHPPSALCFAWENGQPCLKNLKMDELSHLLTGNGESGLDAAERIKRAFPQIRIIIVTSMPECSYLSRAREIGVESFWYKEEQRESLLDVMERTMAGESVYPDATPELQLGLASSYEFTDRELEVLREMTGGDTNQEIAERLHMSVATVKTHILNMLEKTGFQQPHRAGRARPGKRAGDSESEKLNIIAKELPAGGFFVLEEKNSHLVDARRSPFWYARI